jgi:hypothetical protein
MLDSLVRVVLDYQDDGPHRLRTSGLASFTEVFGEDLLVQYCRCYVHADRLESLVSMLHCSLEKQGTESAAAFRLYLTFHAFAVGTLSEATTALDDLRDAPEARRVFDEDEWQNGLQKWLTWSDETPWARKLRNKIAFHLDDKWIRDGLKGLADGDQPFTILAGDSRKARDSYMPLGHSAMLAGADLARSGMLEAIDPDSEIELVSLKDKLGTSFLGALDRCGLKPIPVKCNRVPTYREEVEEITRARDATK